MENRQSNFAPTSLKFSHFSNFFSEYDILHPPPQRVQRQKIKNRLLMFCRERAYLSSDMCMLGSLIKSKPGKIKDISKRAPKTLIPTFEITLFIS